MTRKYTRRRWLSLPMALLGLTLLGQAGLTAEVRKQTYIYKTVGTLPIKADVYRTDDLTERPVVVWIHGGALINGHRESIPSRIKDPLLEAGCVLVSIDYRLAPETKLSGVMEDIEDAFRWIQKDGPSLFHADARQVAVVGGSAGGYLTLTTGYRVRPRPVALVSLWGYGDLVGPWYSTPSPHPRHHRIKLSRDEAFRQVAGPPIADSRNRQGNGGAFYQFCRQQGLWPKAVSGWDPHTEAEKFVPYMPVRNVDADFPPTLLIHGEEDTDVPCEQSVMMAAALRKANVEYRLITLPKAEHGLAGAEAAKIEEAYHAAVEFLTKHLPGAGVTVADPTADSASFSGNAAGATAQPVVAARSANYERVCEPQIKPAFDPLPPGSVEPAGWLRDWAEAARQGITGHLNEDHVVFADAWKGFQINARNAAADGTGWPLEQCAYWLDGALRLGLVLHDEALIKSLEPEAVFQLRQLPYASVLYGPLLFALPIRDVDPNTPAKDARWQYALDTDASRPNNGIQVQRKPMPAHWDWPLDAPVVLSAPAQAFDWHPTDAQALPDQPVTGTTAETVRLVPYGCTKFRISMFPITAAVRR